MGLTTNFNLLFYNINTHIKNEIDTRNDVYENSPILKKGALKASNGIYSAAVLPVRASLSTAFRSLQLINNIAYFIFNSAKTVITFGTLQESRDETVKYAKLTAICSAKIALKPLHMIAELIAHIEMLFSYKDGNQILAELYNIDRQIDHKMGCISNSPKKFPPAPPAIFAGL
jgi:hypothetical protein